jgi:secreted PhoX family phosphatase
MADFENPEGSNNSKNESFQDVLDARLSRRGFVSGGLTAAAALALTGADLLLKAVPASARTRPPARRTPARIHARTRVERRYRDGAAGVHRRRPHRMG